MISYEIWMCLITGTNKPELPRIFLVIKKSCATELLDTAANDVKSDWAKTAAILRMELLSHFDGLELHSSGTWFKPGVYHEDTPYQSTFRR